mgnify:CR=1 FL=1
MEGETDKIAALKLRSPLREARIRREQKQLLLSSFDESSEKLIVILTPGRDLINGGILSIASIFRESVALRSLHGSDVILCTVPGEPLLLKYTKFKNDNDLFELSPVLRHFRNLRYLMIHVPEYAIARTLKNISNSDRRRIARIGKVHINILLQNITLLPEKEYIDALKALGTVTCTTAHEKYTTQETRERLGIPIHRLSVWNSPELYERAPYSRKRDIMIISPDPNSHREEVIQAISKGLPHLKTVVIQNMPYEEFRNTILRAKWALTFGEGLDGYFVETVFSGGVSFAVFNQDFFTADFGELRTVYADYDDLKARICADIANLDDEAIFRDYNSRQFTLCEKYYKHEDYVKNLRLFYEGRYTFL